MKVEYIIGLLLLILIGVGGVVIFASDAKLDSNSIDSPLSQGDATKGTPFVEIANPSGFVNTNDAPIKIADYVGKQVILLDVMTYSCINCQRTFPYITAWYEKYKDDGLIVIGIHTPEFAFEKDKKNVEEAMKKFGITFPVVLDNDYGTWNALNNRFWPHKFLIDIHGNVVYDHAGEGKYEEIETKIRELLKERADVLGSKFEGEDATASAKIVETKVSSRSPETYFGAARNELLANGVKGKVGEQKFVLPSKINPNQLYLGGTWNIAEESVRAITDSLASYSYDAKEVYIVAESKSGADIEVWQDGEKVTSAAGEDVHNGSVKVSTSRLYKLINNPVPGPHTLELRVSPGVQLFTFTFG